MLPLPDSCEVNVDIKVLYMRYASCYTAGAKFIIDKIKEVVPDAEQEFFDFLDEELRGLHAKMARKYNETRVK